MTKVVLMKSLIIHWFNSKISWFFVSGPSGFPVGAVVGVVVGAMVLLGVAALVYFKCFKKENDGKDQKIFSLFTMTIYLKFPSVLVLKFK